MRELFDILLPRPISQPFYEGGIFIFFVIHFIFVLLTLGTAFFAVVSVYRKQDSFGASSPVYFVSKSLAITFGIAALLFVSVFHSVPFATAAALNAPFWISIIALLITAFILLEYFDGKPQSIIGLAVLILVPAVFAAFVASAENPDKWAEIFHNGIIFSSLGAHWLARLAHVLGAAVVVTGLVLLIHPVQKFGRFTALNILFGGLLAQILIGILLYMSLPAKPDSLVNSLIVMGAAGAIALAWTMYSRPQFTERRGLLAALLLFILLPMLTARQILQEKILIPFKDELNAKTIQYKVLLDKFKPKDENRFLTEKQYAYNLPQFIYQRGCAICHGAVGNGHGIEAVNLKVPPADLTNIITRRETLRTVLEEGVPGSAMPYFKFYTKGTLDELMDYLQKYMSIRSYPEEVQVKTTAEQQRLAGTVFMEQCADCHGSGANVSAKGAALHPPARGMGHWALTPGASYKIITEGYPGTSMKSYGYIPDGVRWAIVKKMYGFYERE